MADDWDLQAVVRGCTTTITTTSCSSTTTSTSASNSFYPGFELQQDGKFLCPQDLFFEQRSQSSISAAVDQDLHDLYKAFFPKSSPSLSPQSIPISPLSVLGGLQDLSQQPPQQQPKKQHQQQQQQQQQIYQPKQTTLLSIGVGSRSSGANGSSSTPSHRSKRRKNQLKRVCQVPTEALSSDMWSWRKYGQKPIKGSPYPRGYYRCSTSKGCLARKQVERNRSDPGIFIVTYTAEHNHPMPTHRNSLAGSTRQKPITPQSTSSGDHSKPSSPPVSPSASLSPAPEKLEIETSKEDILEDDDDEVSGFEMAMDDDFFEGLEEFAGKSAVVDNFSPNHFPQSMQQQLPWLENNASSTTATGVD